MKAHELARQLLQLEDLEVEIYNPYTGEVYFAIEVVEIFDTIGIELTGVWND